MIDLITIIGNISQSLNSVQRFVTGGAYLLGIIFVINAVFKFKNVANRTTQSSSQEKMFAPMMYFFFGMMLIYLPTALDIVANTTFGVGNVLSYAPVKTFDLYSAMGLLIRTAGVLWFIRGCVLVAHSSNPGVRDGPKGFVFIFAGIFAMNFDSTIAMINSTLNNFITWTLAVKAKQGF